METLKVELKDRDLAYLPENTDEFRTYIGDLLWAQDFALANREEMMDRVMAELSLTMYKEGGHEKQMENSGSTATITLRKWKTTLARTCGLPVKARFRWRKANLSYPGSMGTRSYIVSGLGNPLSYNSAPRCRQTDVT